MLKNLKKTFLKMKSEEHEINLNLKAIFGRTKSQCRNRLKHFFNTLSQSLTTGKN